jgi:hypothetical protein
MLTLQTATGGTIGFIVVLHSISLSHGQPSMACSRDCDNTVICLADPLLGVHQSIFTASISLKRSEPNEQKKKVELRRIFAGLSSYRKIM